MSDRLVSIDVEPGGSSRPIGYLGIAEVVDGQPGISWSSRFWSPFAPFDWWTWVTTSAAARDWTTGLPELFDQAGVTPGEFWIALQLDGFDDTDREPSPLPSEVPEWDNRPLTPAEWSLPEPPTFSTVLSIVERFVAGDMTAAYGADYDARQIRLLCQRSGARVPPWLMLDGLQLIGLPGNPAEGDAWTEAVVDAQTSGGRTLAASAIRSGNIRAIDAAWQRYQHRRWGVGNKTVLHDAEADAAANAGLFANAMRAARLTDSAQLAQRYSLRLVEVDTLERGVGR